MGFAKVHSGQTRFLAGQIIDIEIDLSRGLHAFSVVGLPDKAVEEARDRISAAIKNSGFRSPKYKNQKVVISLAPADVRKAGPAFDLAMAIGYLLAAGEIRFGAREKLFLGELSLDGRLRPISGTLAIVAEAKRLGFREIFLPKENAREAALIRDVKIFGARSLAEVVTHLNEGDTKSTRLVEEPPVSAESLALVEAIGSSDEIYLEEIKGQESAKRALEIAAAGSHNILFIGPPGAGKTMLAKTLRTILPPLSFEESLEVTAIHSVAGVFTLSENREASNRTPIFITRPFRAPHHTSSYISIAGGGTHPKPGEMTLAHHGVLFLDEFPEFDRRVIEALRQPLEEHRVSISRIKGSVIFPAHFMLVAAMNPCPCGWKNVVGENAGEKSGAKKCRCSLKDVARYSKKISGPILDRIDLRVQVGNVDFEKLENGQEKNDASNKKETEKTKERILAARKLQMARAKTINAYIAGKNLSEFAPIEESAKQRLTESAAAFGLSMRAFHRTWRVARTIADLDSEKLIQNRHILEALQFRGEGEDG